MKDLDLIGHSECLRNRDQKNLLLFQKDSFKRIHDLPKTKIG